MGLFSFLFGSKKVQSTGKAIRIPPPPDVTVEKKYKSSEAAAAIGATIFDGKQIFSGYVDASDKAYFSVLDSDIPKLARWAKDVEHNLTNQGYGYEWEAADCDDRADFFQSLRRFFRKRGSSLLVIKFTVDMKKPALGIGSGGKHQLVAVMGGSGWWVIEPASGDYCRLREYPNLFSIGRQYMH